MSVQRKIAHRAKRRAKRVRATFKNASRPRLSVFRSLKHIYAQLIDDNQGKTLAACSSVEITDLKGDKKAVAKAVGIELAKRVIDKGINEIAFDRGSFLFHGRVKALAEGLSEGGLKI